MPVEQRLRAGRVDDHGSAAAPSCRRTAGPDVSAATQPSLPIRIGSPRHGAPAPDETLRRLHDDTGALIGMLYVGLPLDTMPGSGS